MEDNQPLLSNPSKDDREKSTTQAVVDIEVDEKFSWKRFLQFIGPGFFISIGYIDPGNWATDIAGGSRWGYQLIWVLFVSNLMALLLQMLAARLGIVTERDLAQQCRDQYPRPIRLILWFLCEIAIAATDLAEVLGTAVGLQLLFRIPMIIGVIITAFDTFLFLLLQRFGARKLEFFIFSLLAIVTSCFVIELFLSKPSPMGILEGFIPRLSSQSLYDALGMLGATVMPHNFYLHSSVVLSRKFGRHPSQIKLACLYNLLDSTLALNIAFFINAAILAVSAAAFWTRGIVVEELQDAHSLLEGFLNSSVAPIMFGLGLLCAGQSSTITGTMAGQIVMEGFLDIKLRPWMRRMVTRLVAIIPAIVVILIMGDKGTYDLLILSQVILSAQLPFAIVPLIGFTSNRKIMGDFVNPVWVIVLSVISAAVVIALNIWLVWQSIYPLFVSASALNLSIGIFVALLSLALILLLVYISVKAVRDCLAKREDYVNVNS